MKKSLLTIFLVLVLLLTSCELPTTNPPQNPEPPKITITKNSEIIKIAGVLRENEVSNNRFYVKGRIVSVDNDTYGNLTITDEYGVSLYIYGIYDESGSVRYDKLSYKPTVGDTVTLYGAVKNFVSAYETKPELINARLIECEKGDGKLPEKVPGAQSATDGHTDLDNNGYCDDCNETVIMYIDLFAINDMHGKLTDAPSFVGVDELTTFLKKHYEKNENTVLISSGDMWQGSAESNITDGFIITEWMNEVNFDSMTLGNHEFDWGVEAIKDNLALAEFPFLAINIYDRETNERVSYAQPSVMVERNGLKIGIIGAIGNCYSSISAEQSGSFYFKTGVALTELVQAESERLRDAGADLIVYSIHGGHGSSASGVTNISNGALASYYDVALSEGYVDVVFEGHSHQKYIYVDSKNVYHIQGGDDNDGVSYAELAVNFANGKSKVTNAQFISCGVYASNPDDDIVVELVEKYADKIEPLYKNLGSLSSSLSSNDIKAIAAKMYLEAGMLMWGEEYNIVLGGGYMSTRSPNYLSSGAVTYGDVYTVLPFDNSIVLCSISGTNLLSQFINNGSYANCYSDYGKSIKDNIDLSATYYVLVDTYSSTYARNGLTEIATLSPGVYARDLVAYYIEHGEAPNYKDTPTPPVTDPTDPTVTDPTDPPVTDPTDPECSLGHTDDDDNGICDSCDETVIVIIDIYAINDLHGKLDDTDSQPGVDELTTYLKNANSTDDHTIFLSSGDMWQGSSESNLTRGSVIIDWMNELDFVSMTLGNHEFDWSEEQIEKNALLAEFPFLAINIYDRTTNMPVDYCTPSVVIERGGVKVGIIGAIGDCYSSISAEFTTGIYFKTGSELTSLVKAESDRLRAQGVDFIIYSLHYDSSDYDELLSDGYVDVVFEGHTHQGYVTQDSYGVYHLQNEGDNGGITHVEFSFNLVKDEFTVRIAEEVETSEYEHLPDDPIVDEILLKYEDELNFAYETLGYNPSYMSESQIAQLVCQLYLEAGLEKWGSQYDIVLAGAFINTRSPYALSAGNVTYADLCALLPFDNEIVLCKVSGAKLKSRFIENSSYYPYFSSYGEGIKDNINSSATYYIITDTYSSTYSYNGLTEVARYGAGIYARDLLAEYFKEN